MTPAFWGLLQGWITVFSWIAICATLAFLIGTQIEGLLILNDSTYFPKGWHGTLLAWDVLFLPMVCIYLLNPLGSSLSAFKYRLSQAYLSQVTKTRLPTIILTLTY